MCRPVLQTLTLFRTKLCKFPVPFFRPRLWIPFPFSDLVCKIHMHGKLSTTMVRIHAHLQTKWPKNYPPRPGTAHTCIADTREYPPPPGNHLLHTRKASREPRERNQGNCRKDNKPPQLSSSKSFFSRHNLLATYFYPGYFSNHPNQYWGTAHDMA